MNNSIDLDNVPEGTSFVHNGVASGHKGEIVAYRGYVNRKLTDGTPWREVVAYYFNDHRLRLIAEWHFKECFEFLDKQQEVLCAEQRS
jgi:hypothetical protein